MYHDDPFAPLRRGIADQPVGGVVKGRPQHKDVATRDGGVVGKGQNVDPGRGGSEACGVRRFGIERADNDLSAVIDRGCGLIRGRLRVACCTVDPQVDFDAVEAAYREAGGVFEVLGQQVVTALSGPARDKQGNRHGLGGVYGRPASAAAHTPEGRGIARRQGKGGQWQDGAACRLAQRPEKRKHDTSLPAVPGGALLARSIWTDHKRTKRRVQR